MLVAVKGNREYVVTDENKAMFEKQGYKLVEVTTKKTDTPKKPEEKPVDRMNTAELEAKAAELGVDLKDATTNKQRVEAIQAYLNDTPKKPE